jgi:uncharacterized RDD family membrane protein YckC
VTQPPPGYQPPLPHQPPTDGYSVPPRAAYPPPPGYRPLPVAPNGAPLADFGQRLGAYLIDSLILGGVAVVLFCLGAAVLIPIFLSGARGRNVGDNPRDFTAFFLAYAIFIAVYMVVSIGLQYLYQVVYQVRKGQTVGKRAMKIKIVSLADGSPMDRTAANKRFLVHVGCTLLGPLAYLDGLWQLWDQPYRQCLHDKWPQTVVVRVPS